MSESGFFNVNNGFFTTLGKIFDLFVLNLLWTICCLLFFVIGIPASSALYYTVVKNVRRDRGYLLKVFFTGFKNSLKQGIVFSLIFTLLGSLMYFNITYAVALNNTGDSKGTILLGIYIAITIAVVMTLTFVPPVLSRWSNKFSQLFKYSLFLSVRHFPTTFLVILIWAVVALCAYLTYGMALLILPAPAMLLTSFLFERVFKKYMPTKEKADEDNPDEDHWYLE